MELKDSYTGQEWGKRKEYYINYNSSLVIPRESTIQEVRQLIALNNNILTQAYYDKSILSEKLETERRKLNLLEEEAWCSIDWDGIGGGKLIKEEKKSYIVKYIKQLTNESINGADINIYDKVSTLTSRFNFIESLVYNLKDKASALYNLIGLLKIEYDSIKYENYLSQGANQYEQ